MVVFSNGPDNASVVPPEDVAELAQSTGTAIYMICTREAQLEPISTAVFERMTAATGGKAYFAKSWKEEKRSLCVDQRRLGTSLFAELLPPAEPQPRLAEYHGEIDFGPFEEMPLAHA